MAAVRVPEIDLLRFIAAFAILLYHYTFRGYAADDMSVLSYLWVTPVTKYFYLTIYLLFLVSGFGILMTAAHGSPKSFLIARIVRLYPAFWVCCTLTFLMTLLAGGDRFDATFGQYVANMTLLSGFLRIPSIDNVYWSLFVEIKFYGLVYVILLSHQIHRAKQLLGVWLALTVVALAWPVKYVWSPLLPDYAPWFIAGAMFFLVHKEGLCLYKGVVITVSYIIAVTQVFKELEVYEAYYQTSFNDGLVAIILASFFLVFFLIAMRRTAALGAENWLFLSALTYPLYLLHENIGFMIFNALYEWVNVHVLLWGVVAFMLWLSYVVNIRVEQMYARPMKAFLERLFRWAFQCWAHTVAKHR